MLKIYNQTFEFTQKIKSLRLLVLDWAIELSKEEGKKDFDAMAKLISDYEQLEDRGTVGWALNRIRSISPSINDAENKLNKVIDSVKYKLRFVSDNLIEDNAHRLKLFHDEDNNLLPEELDNEGFTSLNNVGLAQ